MLWVEEARPQNLKEMVLDDKNRGIFQKYIGEGVFPHLLLFGKAGTGKTTLARILIKETKCDILELNASDERGIDTIRDKIGTFVKSKTLESFRCVFLDEADGLTPAAQQSLRVLMEKFHKNAKFIFTCNYVNKIIPPIRSRCTEFNLKMLDMDQMKAMLKGILEKKKITGDNVDGDIEQILKESQFDLRKSINNLQRYCINGSLKIDKQIGEFDKLVALMVKKDIPAVKRYLVENEINYDKLYRYLFESTDKPKSLEKLAKYYYQHHFVADPEINFVGMVADEM